MNLPYEPVVVKLWPLSGTRLLRVSLRHGVPLSAVQCWMHMEDEETQRKVDVLSTDQSIDSSASQLTPTGLSRLIRYIVEFANPRYMAVLSREYKQPNCK